MQLHADGVRKVAAAAEAAAQDNNSKTGELGRQLRFRGGWTAAGAAWWVAVYAGQVVL